MARILSTGFESGLLDAEVDTRAGSMALSTTVVRTGGYSIYLASTSILPFFILNWPNGALTEAYGGFGFLSTGSTYGRILVLRDADANSLVELNLLESGALSLTCNGTTNIGAIAYARDEWHYIEWHYKWADSGGIVEIKIDGTDTGLTISGDTKAVGTTAPLQQYHANKGASASTPMYWDDIVTNDTTGSVNNGWPGRVKLYPLRPTGAGDVTGLIRGGTDSGANWSQVEEVPASATDYVYSDEADDYDLYEFGTMTLPAGYEVANIIPVHVCQLDSGDGKITSKIKSDGTEAQGEDHVLTNSQHAYSDAFPVNPNTSAAWDQDDIDAIQAGPMTRAAA